MKNRVELAGKGVRTYTGKVVTPSMIASSTPTGYNRVYENKGRLFRSGVGYYGWARPARVNKEDKAMALKLSEQVVGTKDGSQELILRNPDGTIQAWKGKVGFGLVKIVNNRYEVVLPCRHTETEVKAEFGRLTGTAVPSIPTDEDVAMSQETGEEVAAPGPDMSGKVNEPEAKSEPEKKEPAKEVKEKKGKKELVGAAA